MPRRIPAAPTPLVELPGKSISFEMAKMQNPSVEQWCREALKKIAVTCIEAEGKLA